VPYIEKDDLLSDEDEILAVEKRNISPSIGLFLTA
jgi:hypothetical protein